MELWQKKRIHDNLVELIKNTTCNAELITRLSATNVLGESDEQQLGRVILMPFEKSKLLYEILSTRRGAFKILLKALEETRQTGALTLLNEPDTSKYQNFGLIKFDKNHILGRGCAGTVVYKGEFDGRDVAVKVLNSLQIEFKIALNEVAFLKKVDKHENIVRYFLAEKDNNLIYIALELFEINLQDEMKMKVVNLDPTTLLRKITAGVSFLHSQNILHQDLKPANILLNRPDIVKISDFGMSKEIPDGETSVTVSGAAGTADWMAPEILTALYDDEMFDIQHIKMTSTSDVFSLGCIFYYVMSNGTHPFGRPGPRRQDNIMNDKPQLKALTPGDRWMNLIRKMIAHSPKDRPSALHVFEELTEFTELSTESDQANKEVLEKAQDHTEPISLTNIDLDFSIKTSDFDDNKIPEESPTKGIEEPINDANPLMLPHASPTQIKMAKDCETDNYETKGGSKLQEDNGNGRATSLAHQEINFERFLFPLNSSFDYQALLLSDIQFQGRVCKLEETGVREDDLADILSSGLYQKEYLQILNKEHELILTKNTFPSIPPFYVSRKLYVSSDQYTEKEFLDHTKESRLVLICDIPEMGKSMLLSSLAHQILEKNIKEITVYIKLLEFIKFDTIISIKYTKNASHVQSQIPMPLMEQISATPLAKALLMKIIGRYKVHIFFDEFDQIPIKYIPLCKDILKILSQCTLDLTMYVTSRHQNKKDLEETFGLNCFSIRPFDRTDQITFFSSFWNHMIPNLSNNHDENQVLDYAERYLQEISAQLTNKNDQLCITSIPSICLELAYAQIQTNKRDKLSEPFIINAFVICQEYIHNVVFKYESNMEDISLAYIEKSLKVLCPEVLYEKQDHKNFDDEEFSETIVSMFKESFVAEYFAYLLTGCTPFQPVQNQMEYFISKYILSFEKGTPIYVTFLFWDNASICLQKFEKSSFVYLLSMHLNSFETKSIDNCITKSFSNLVNPENLYNIIISCVQNPRYVHLLRTVEIILLTMDEAYLSNCRAFLIEQIPHETVSQDIRGLSRCVVILIAATWYSNIEMIRACLDFFKNCFKYEGSTSCANIPFGTMSPVDVAIEKSDVEVVKFLSKNRISKESALSDYVAGSYRKDAKIITRKLEMCKMLLDWNKRFMTENVLFTRGIHLEFIKYLVQKGANIYDGTTKETIVEHTLKYMSEDEFYELCHFLFKIDRIGLSIFKSNLPKWKSPFHGLYNYYDHFTKIMKILDIPGIDLNEPDEDGNTLILNAARVNTWAEILKRLIDHGADVNVTNKQGQNALHVAVDWPSAFGGFKTSNFEVATIQFLVSVGVDVNARNNEGKIPREQAEQVYQRHKESVSNSKINANNAEKLKLIVEFLKKIDSS